MLRDASLYLACRYLKPKRSLVSTITLLSILGPTLGVAVLIIVLSVMAGFNRDIREKILGMQAHIHLKDRFGEVIENPETLIDKLNNSGLKASPIVEGPVLIQTQNRVLAKYVKGIVPKLENEVTDIGKSVINGHFDLKEHEVLIGKELANQCNLNLGDTFLIHSPEKLNSMVTFENDGSVKAAEEQEIYTPEEVTIAGIFSLGMYDYDTSILVLHLDKADELFGLNWGSATSIQIKTPDPFDLNPAMTQIACDPILESLRPITWQQSNQRLFGALRVEKNLMFFLLTFIMIVAAFGIATTLITVVIQKTGEIGILKALGATSSTILLIFVYQGAIVGLIGTLLGTGLGLFIVHHRNSIANMMSWMMGIEIFPKDLYHLSKIPGLVQPSDIIKIVMSALLICVLGALIPAIFAASLSPTDALRDEI